MVSSLVYYPYKTMICKALKLKDLNDMPKSKFPEAIRRLNKSYSAYTGRWKELKGFRSLLP